MQKFLRVICSVGLLAAPSLAAHGASLTRRCYRVNRSVLRSSQKRISDRRFFGGTFLMVMMQSADDLRVTHSHALGGMDREIVRWLFCCCYADAVIMKTSSTKWMEVVPTIVESRPGKISYRIA